MLEELIQRLTSGRRQGSAMSCAKSLERFGEFV